jgi:predicted transcriptional regulator
MEKLSPNNLYNLRLVGMKNRYYRLRQAARYLEKFGYIERTGRMDTTGEQYEFTITEKGRLALERFGGC